MRILLTAGPTREPIDAVRYIGNRSSGKMGASIAAAAVNAGHAVTLILGPVAVPMPLGVGRRIDIESSADMEAAVVREFPAHDVLIMAAAVADYRPRHVTAGKLPRHDTLTIELDATTDIVAAAGAAKRPDQRTVGFSLETSGDLDRAKAKMLRKHLDLMVHNPTETMNARTVTATLLYPDGRVTELPCRDKADFADILLQRVAALF